MGKFNVFTGPIRDQKGKIVVPAEEEAQRSSDLVLGQWLAKGVVGKVSTVAPPA